MSDEEQHVDADTVRAADLGAVDGLAVEASLFAEPLLGQATLGAEVADAPADLTALLEQPGGKIGGHPATLAGA